MTVLTCVVADFLPHRPGEDQGELRGVALRAHVAQGGDRSAISCVGTLRSDPWLRPVFASGRVFLRNAILVYIKLRLSGSAHCLVKVVNVLTSSLNARQRRVGSAGIVFFRKRRSD